MQFCKKTSAHGLTNDQRCNLKHTWNDAETFNPRAIKTNLLQGEEKRRVDRKIIGCNQEKRRRVNDLRISIIIQLMFDAVNEAVNVLFVRISLRISWSVHREKTLIEAIKCDH